MYILIVNEQPLGRALASELMKNKHEVAYLDESNEHCELVAAELGCLVINGETTNINLLKEAGIEHADVVVALHEKDIKNIMVGIFARQFNVPRILAHLKQAHYHSAYELAGIQEIFSAFDYLLNKMVISIEDPYVKQVMTLGDGSTEIVTLEIKENCHMIGKPLQRLWDDPSYPQGLLILGVNKSRGQKFILPRDKPIFEADDELLLIGRDEDIHRVAKLLNQIR